jgi:hypothetical protein
MEFSLERFEYFSYSRQHEPAARELVQLLGMLDTHYGKLGPGFAAEPSLGVVSEHELDLHITTRIAGAISALFSDPSFFITPDGFTQLISWQRWISVIFSTSAYRNADHILRALNLSADNLKNLVIEDERQVIKLCLLYTPDSELVLDIDAFFSYNKTLAVALGIALLSARFMGSRAAHGKRETLLGWLPNKLPAIGDIELLPVSILHDVYMNCTYADRADKHEIKRAINQLIRKKLLEANLTDLDTPLLATPGQKPTMLVVLEWFTSVHSIYRVLSQMIKASGQHFRLVGISFEIYVDDKGREIFDEFVVIPPGNLRSQIETVRETVRRVTPTVMFMPSLGMSLLSIYISNLRLAPIQAFAFGHPATSHSGFMDYFVIEDDFIGDPACFSEKLLRLPAGSFPFVPSAILPDNLTSTIRLRPHTVRIAVPGSLMKLNPQFLETCRAIADAARTPVQFHFLVGLSEGLVWPQVQHTLHGYLGERATVYPHLHYHQYMRVLSECDLFINPFPFGNGNGVVDALTFNLPGVCRSGREVCEHVDDGLFRRAGLPDWLITQSTEAYIAATVRLIDNHEERVKISGDLTESKAVTRLFTGNAPAFGDRLIQLVEDLRAGV